MGLDITNKVDFRGLTITDTQEVTGDTLTITMYGFDQDIFPIPIKEITIIEDSHTAIARGCLSEAQLIEEEEEDKDEEESK